MKALVFGSLNIDKVYSLEKLPEKGETLRCTDHETHVGGKGLNQAIALRKAGFDVTMAGAIGNDGAFLKDYLDENGVDTSLLLSVDGFTGHAVIEVDKEGQNQMILFAGANYAITPAYCDKVLEGFSAGDMILMQYETSCVEYMINAAREIGLTVVLNPSPYVKAIQDIPFDKVDILVLNESEGINITGENDVKKVPAKLLERMNGGKVVLTLGADGAVYADGKAEIKVPAFKVNAADTTGAGDTFTGYFLKTFTDTGSPGTALKTASAASAVAVTKKGAAETIPSPAQVSEFLMNNTKS